MIGFIYYLRDPKSRTIVYVGATRTSLNVRLRTHYQHAREAEMGKRKMSKRHKYLLDLLPDKVTIHLIEIVPECLLDVAEIRHIKSFKKLGYTLLNMTDGGRGGCTNAYYNEDEFADYTNKISNALKGLEKTQEFRDNLSVSRTGLGNTMVGTSKLGRFAAMKDGVVIKEFDYPFEVDLFIGKKKAWSNVQKVLKGILSYKPYGYEWKLL